MLHIKWLSFCRYGNSLSTDVSWQQSGSSCHCMPPSCGTSDLGDATEDEEVQRDPRASSTLLLEEAQVGSGLSFSATLHQRNTFKGLTQHSFVEKSEWEIV